MRCDRDMNTLLLLFLRSKLGALLLVFGLLVGASAVCAQTPLADGQVVKIDQAAGKITIRHGPLKQFGMEEGMTMVYRAADPAMLNAVKPGDKIKFAPDRVNGQFTVTKIEKAK
jgi:Cu/Ag efflux protein CusF